MAPRIYTSVVTIGSISIYQVTGDPNGTLTAARGSLAIDDSSPPLVWQNEDGAALWGMESGGAVGERPAVRVATTGNIDLATGGLLTIDGVGPLSTGDRVLVWQQTTPSENGIYEVAAGAWTRVEDLETNDEFDETTIVFVKEGSTYAVRLFKLVTPPPITVGTTAISWALEAVDGPDSVVDNNLPAWDGTALKKLKDSGISVAEVVALLQAVHVPCRVASTANVDIGTGGLLSIDGVGPLTAGDRVLLWRQTDPVENGIYIVAAGAWVRASDLDTGAEFDNTSVVYVQEGTTWADRQFKLTTNPSVTVGVTAITWELDSVEGPATVVDNNSVAWDTADGKKLKDSGFSADALIGSFGVPSLVNMYVTSTDPRMVSLGGGDVVGPVGAIDENIAIYDGISGKIIKDGGVNLTQLRSTHEPCRVASTADVDVGVGGLLSIDGVGPLVAGDRVLLWRQTVGTENGIYLVAAGAWTRALDLDLGAEFDVTSTVYVQEGDTWADRQFKLKTDRPVTVGITTITFALNSVDGPETVVDENMPVFDGTDKKLIKDSGLALSDLTVAVQTGPFVYQLMFTTQSNPYITFSATSYQELGSFIFPGTARIGSPSAFKAVLERISGGGSAMVRIFDLTNGNVISTSAAFSSSSKTVVPLGAISSLPVGEAIFEVQGIRITPGPGATTAVYFLMLEF